MLFTDFSSNYEIIVNPELPGTGKWSIPEIHIPADFKVKVIGDHLILKVKAGQQWQVWHVESEANSEIWTTPDPDRILIAGREGALYVSVKDPSDVTRIKLSSVRVTAAREQGILLLNDYFSVTALDSSGIRWQTPGLVDDDMTIKTVDGNRIICSGFSFRNPNVYGDVKIVLDLSTGSVLHEDELPERKSYLHSIRNRLTTIAGKTKNKSDSAVDKNTF